MELKLKSEEIRKLLNINSPEFPKYATQLINLANQNAQATRPKVVGQMSELIKQFTGKTLEEWEQWYLHQHPEAIDIATKKILNMLENFKQVINQIDEKMVRQWIKDLVIVKTFIGLRFQEAILKKIAEMFNKDYKLASVEDESKGIDGYIGNIPVSLKPITYKTKSFLSEQLQAEIIFYDKVKDGIKITVHDDLINKLKQS